MIANGNAAAQEDFDAQTTTKGVRVRNLAAAIAEEYKKSDTADRAIINAIVDELLVLTP